MLQLSSEISPSSLIDITSAHLGNPGNDLAHVGMQGIDLPLQINENQQLQRYVAKADVGVNLRNRKARGIHMSRLYLLLHDFSQQHCSPAALKHLVQKLGASQQETLSDEVTLSLQFNSLLAKPALLTPNIGGWQSYPVRLHASWRAQQFRLQLTVQVLYSSTCPCSAALSRQLLQQKFLTDFAKDEQISKSVLADWLMQHGSYATPHSQRSVATVTVDITEQAALGIQPLILLAEQSLNTPVQTAVKRADEQAFAKLNGQNLMFVEDAARRLAMTISAQFPIFSIDVKHLESLHPHDAVARVAAGELR